MSYKKQTWNKYDGLKTEKENIENGAVVTDNRMNHIEEGISSHTIDISNPHKVTAAQVGLGNIQNFGLATEDEAKQGISNAKYMTPSLTQAVLSANINSIAYANSADGTNGFTTVYPNLNLLDGTKDFSGDWTNSSSWVTDGTYKGLTVKKRTTQWVGIYKTFTAPKDGIYTFSAYIKSSGATANISRFTMVNGKSNSVVPDKEIGSNFGWLRDSVSVTLKAGDKVSVRYEIMGSALDSILWTAGHKWEEGSTATDELTTSYPNLNLLGGTIGFKPKDAGNGTANQYVGAIYFTQNKTLADLFKAGDYITISYDIEFLNTELYSSSEDVNTTIQMHGGSHTWISQIKAKNVGGKFYTSDPFKSSGYVETPTHKVTVSRTIQLTQDFINANATVNAIELVYNYIPIGANIKPTNLKLEPGSTATPWMPSKNELQEQLTPWMPSLSEVTTADWPKYVGFSNTVKTNKSASDYTWFPVKDSELTNKVEAHINNKANPHAVTASQVGAYSKTESDSKLTDLSNKVIANKGNLASGTDLDNVIDNGTYRIGGLTGGTDIINVPSERSGTTIYAYLTVSGTTTSVVQELIVYDSKTVSQIYSRSRSGSTPTFNHWSKTVMADDSGKVTIKDLVVTATVKTVNLEITGQSTKTVSIYNGGGQIILTRIGPMVQADIRSMPAIPSNTTISGVIPDGYKPAADYTSITHSNNRLIFYANGSIKPDNNAMVSDNGYYSCSWVTKDATPTT